MVKFNLNLERLLFSNHDLIIAKLNQLSSKLDIRSPNIEAIPVNVSDNLHENFPKSSIHSEINSGYVRCNDTATIYRGKNTHDIILFHKHCDETLSFKNTSKLLHSKQVSIITNNILLIKNEDTSDHSILKEVTNCTSSLIELLELLDERPTELSTYIKIFQLMDNTELTIWVKIMQYFTKLSDVDKIVYFITIMTAWEKFYISPDIKNYHHEQFPLNFNKTGKFSDSSELKRYNVPSVIHYMVDEVSKIDIPNDIFIQYIAVMKKFVQLSKAVFSGVQYENPDSITSNFLSSITSNFLSNKMNYWANTNKKIDNRVLEENLVVQVNKVKLNKYQIMALTSVMGTDKVNEIPSKLIDILKSPIPRNCFITER